jgi:pimeloyl-ACP methyl ester carboxylesterase
MVAELELDNRCARRHCVSSMHRLASSIALLAAFALVAAFAAPEDDRGRPVVLLVHGRGMLDRDSSATRAMWIGGLGSATKALARQSLISERDVRIVWYADVLDPRSDAGCDYSPADPRARRDAATDPDLKTFVSLAGSVLGALGAFVTDTEAGAQLRGFAGDAAFLSDARKRCAAEQRLGDAIDRAQREGRPIILVAHSLGALVAYDYLSTRRDTGVVQRFITIGSIVGSPELRHLLVGGDSTDTLVTPASVKRWVNIRNDRDPLATPLSVGRDVVVTVPADEADPHEMIGYLRGSATAGEVLSGWCAAFGPRAPSPAGCAAIPAMRP